MKNDSKLNRIINQGQQYIASFFEAYGKPPQTFTDLGIAKMSLTGNFPPIKFLDEGIFILIVRRRIFAWLIVLSVPFTWLLPAYATPVRLHVQAPIEYNNPKSTNLQFIENYGWYPVFSRDFKVPYDSLEPMFNDRLDDIVPNKISGVEVCGDPCPDVNWSLKIDPKFKFTQKNQPVVTSIGSSGQSKIHVELTSQARLDVHADMHAETWFDSADAPVDMFAVIGVKASVDVELWPEVRAFKPGTGEPGIEVEFSLVDKSIDLQLNGQAVALGAKWGTVIGLSPAGLLVGGPILGPILAVLGNEAADMAEEVISKIFHERVEAMFQEQADRLEDMVIQAVNPYIAQANQIRNEVLAAPLPGIGMSLDQLSPLLGMTIQLHTISPNGGLAASAITRFTAAAGTGQIQGKMRMPKKICECVKIKGGPLDGAKIPLGLVDTNTDLKTKVGQACTSVVGGGFTRKAFIGGNPQHTLGSAAQKLSEWNASTGTLTWLGMMTQTDKWYECAFSVTNLPTAAIIELHSEVWLDNHHVSFKDRYLKANIPGDVLLDNHLKPVEGGQLVLGGEGTCSASGGGGHGVRIPQNKLDSLRDMLNPEKCPKCGIKGRPGIDKVINVANGAALASTPAGKAVLGEVLKRRSMPKRALSATAAAPAQP